MTKYVYLSFYYGDFDISAIEGYEGDNLDAIYEKIDECASNFESGFLLTLDEFEKLKKVNITKFEKVVSEE